MIERIIVQGYRLFHDLDFKPTPGMNIFVGDNDSGKSTLLEAITLGLTGRLNGRWIGDELHPYCFNADIAKKFFERSKSDPRAQRPEILIELHLANGDEFQALRGKVNSKKSDVPGLVLRVAPSPEFAVEFEEYLRDPDCPELLPVEYYSTEWRTFSDQSLQRRPKNLGVARIDSRTIRSSAGVDYHTRQILTEFIEEKEHASISVAHRKARYDISAGAMSSVNERISTAASDLVDGKLELHMDMSAGASWEADLVPQIENFPFAMTGQGRQAATKVALALHRSAESTRYVLVEEPENHMSHTSLTKLVDRIVSLASDRQVFVSTHSSFVLNRLGLDHLTLLHRGRKAKFDDLPPDTVQYFKRLSGYDTMRIVLAETVVLVEGPSDEIALTRAHLDFYGKTPMERGVDIISMQGVALKRGFELGHALDRKMAAVRDNDGHPGDHWRHPLLDLLKPDKRQVFIGSPERGRTLEPQLAHVNADGTLRKVVGCPSSASDLVSWMSNNKTETALAIAESDARITYPDYFQQTLAFLA